MEQNRMYSIIVVCLNAGQRLQDTVESILGQRYENFEVVVKDGGSSDGSIEMLGNIFLMGYFSIVSLSPICTDK